MTLQFMKARASDQIGFATLLASLKTRAGKVSFLHCQGRRFFLPISSVLLQTNNSKNITSKTFGALDLPQPFGKNATRCMPQKSSARTKRRSRREARDLDVKISFLEGIVGRDPQYVEALQILGDHYTQRGKFEDSLKVDKRLSRLEPRNPLVFYNLACSYSLNRELDRAAAALEKALLLGYRDFKWLAKDPDLRPLRKHPIYRIIEDKIRKMKVKIKIG